MISEDQRYENMTGPELRRNMYVEYAKRYDTGHDFFTEKTSAVQLEKTSQLYSPLISGHRVFYDGPVVLKYGLIDSTTIMPSMKSYAPSGSQITIDGTKLWSMAVPTAAEGNLAAFLGELREGLPHLPGSSISKPSTRKAGDEYLNWKFGVQPLKSDLQKLARGIVDFSKRVKQYQRDSGKIIRRRRSLSDTRFEVDITTAAGYDAMLMPISDYGFGDEITRWFYSNLGSIKVIDIVDTSVWFSGSYSYYLSEAHSFLGKLDRYVQLANHALGVEFDLDTAWELTPWSWLADWFSDAGSFVKNIVALSNDNVVARYAYVMHHQKVTRVYTTTGMVLKPDASGPTTATVFKTYESKARTAATPYGFGFNMGALSNTQKAILGALGLTRSPGVLHKS